MIKTFLTAASAAALALSFGFAASAADFEVKLLNKGADGAMVFEPGAIKVAKGDTVNFTPTDKGHDVESIPNLIPAGATPFKGKISEAVKVTFDVPGLYVVRCSPHFGMGMVAIVQVGDAPSNLDAVKAATFPGKAKERVANELKALGL